MANQNQHIEATRTQLNAFHLARPRPGLAQRNIAARARRSDANSSANRAIRQKRRHGVKSRASKQDGDCKRSPHVRRSRSRSPPPGPGAGLASLASAPRGKDGRVVPGVVNYGK
jgi:hypothetical protein